MDLARRPAADGATRDAGTPDGRASGREPGGAAAPGSSGVPGVNGESISATDLLVELAQCQRAIRDLLRSASATLGPICNQTLPSVVFTLTGLIHATEVAANKVLDQSEELAGDQDRLAELPTASSRRRAAGPPRSARRGRTRCSARRSWRVGWSPSCPRWRSRT